MATLQLRNESFRVLFCYHGKRYTYTIGAVEEKEAELVAANVDRILLRVQQKLLHLPVGMDIITFIRNDGKPPETEETIPADPKLTVRQLKDRYLETHRHGSMEDSSLATASIHLNHVEKSLGPNFPVGELSLADLQNHVTSRSKKKYRCRPLSPATLKKEMATFRAAWNWAVLMGIVKGPFPNKGLVYPKHDEKPAFQTMEEITRKITGLTEEEGRDLWDCLFLTQDEVAAFLSHVREKANQAWIYPAVCFAAHTGARRSEIIRVRLIDLDLDAATVLIHEKKRAKGKRTTRRVPLSPLLLRVLKGWLAQHPGGAYLFCNGEVVHRSKKRSRTTGHHGAATRQSSQKGRVATVKKRELPPVGGLTKDEAHDHFHRAIAGSKWSVLKGWHVLRHSFISNCAAKGVDQRLIDAWVGHQTEEMRKRYRHLIPSVEQEAIKTVFGEGS